MRRIREVSGNDKEEVRCHGDVGADGTICQRHLSPARLQPPHSLSSLGAGGRTRAATESTAERRDELPAGSVIR